YGYLARPQYAPRATLKAQKNMDVVVQLAARDECVHVSRDCLAPKSGDEAGHVIGMGTDVAERSGGSRALRIGAPLCLLVAASLQWLGKPILRIFDLHQAHLTERSPKDHLARLTHHWVAGVGVRQSKN